MSDWIYVPKTQGACSIEMVYIAPIIRPLPTQVDTDNREVSIEYSFTFLVVYHNSKIR